MVLLSSDVSSRSRSTIAMDCSSVAAALVPHPMSKRGEPAGAGGNTVSSGVSANPLSSSWHHHKHEQQLMLLEKQKTKGESDSRGMSVSCGQCVGHACLSLEFVGCGVPLPGSDCRT
ncbi:hypothetical protein ONE63_002191 [Megalurothrips usitatus]|uniref:Uncharacterized protein n=1 Tax=Megalurothrips usitatus TaxID=439358 RepID=A0AAV7XAQ7_9NEOP|nr:hypothetical protein ONE63_002191 [Megalurothrips usitatus]